MAGVEYTIVRHIGVVGNRGTWPLELNLVSWGGSEPKYDLRAWDPDHKKCGKGIALTAAELDSLVGIVSGMN